MAESVSDRGLVLIKCRQGKGRGPGREMTRGVNFNTPPCSLGGFPIFRYRTNGKHHFFDFSPRVVLSTLFEAPRARDMAPNAAQSDPKEGPTEVPELSCELHGGVPKACRPAWRRSKTSRRVLEVSQSLREPSQTRGRLLLDV